MADPVQGILELQSDPEGITRIVLNPTAADITAGGNGSQGDLILKNASGSEVVRLGRVQETMADPQATMPVVIAEYTGLRIRNAAGLNLIQVGRIAKAKPGMSAAPDEIAIIVGGHGFAAKLRLLDKDNKTRVVIGRDDSGEDGRFILFSVTGKKVLEFDAGAASLFVGAEGIGGDVVVRDHDNEERIRLDGGHGDVRVRSAAGKTLLLFDNANASLRIGGNIRENDRPNLEHDNKARIKLDGSHGDISVRSASGKNLLRFENSDATLHVGGETTAGAIVVRNGAGTETIRLDGDQGDIILANADCAEEFDAIDSTAEVPGTVVVIGDDERLTTSMTAYDRRVAGVVSGAGTYRAGIVLDRRPDRERRPAVALIGKVFCRVDASYGSISVGDLLVSSSTPGHAMVATDATRWPGAVLGKALRPWRDGRGLIPILVTLQ